LNHTCNLGWHPHNQNKLEKQTHKKDTKKETALALSDKAWWSDEMDKAAKKLWTFIK